jgi:hypothetical protein
MLLEGLAKVKSLVTPKSMSNGPLHNPPTSKLKGFVHINKDKEDPSGNIQRGPKPKPKPKLRWNKRG